MLHEMVLEVERTTNNSGTDIFTTNFFL